ncbi:MAG: hypothetical protein ACREDP_18475 [Bradyrhizobium sp.]
MRHQMGQAHTGDLAAGGIVAGMAFIEVAVASARQGAAWVPVAS